MPDALIPSTDQTAAGLPPSAEELRPHSDPTTGIDLSLIQENLKLTPWERILANDDTANFCDTARAAINDQNAAANRTARPAD